MRVTAPLLLAVLAAAAAAAVAAPPALAQQAGPAPRQIVVTGEGQVTAAPDMAVIQSGVMTEAATAAEAVAANSAAMEKVVAALRRAGIEPRDIQTSDFSVQPRYVHDDRGTNPPRLVGYMVSNMVGVRVRALDRLGAVLDDLVAAGANQIHGLSFDIADKAALLDDARRAAVEDARRKADLYAKAAGVRLGALISIDERAGQARPVQFRAMAAESFSGRVPVQTGEQTLQVQIDAAWGLAGQ